MKFKVLFDDGKPYEEEFKNLIELKQNLKSLYMDNPQADFKVFDDNNNDISETQIIRELCESIINNEV
jgi:hypothetical protein